MTIDYQMALDERSAVQAEFIRLFGSLVQDVGFVRLVGHPIDRGLIGDVYAIADEVFALPLEVKRRYHNEWFGAQRGLAGGEIKAEVYDGKAREGKEMLTIGRRMGVHPLFLDYPTFPFPRDLPGSAKKFARVMELFDCLHEMFEVLIRFVARFFNIDPEKLLCTFDRHATDAIMRLLRYAPGVGGHEHRDTGMLTLMVAPTDAGLEIKNRSGAWESFKTAAGEIVVNTGKLLAFIVNALLQTDALEAREHRVRAELRKLPEAARGSIPFFGWPSPNHVLPDGRRAWEFLRDDLIAHGFWPPKGERPAKPIRY